MDLHSQQTVRKSQDLGFAVNNTVIGNGLQD